jgi:hypothetical protein
VLWILAAVAIALLIYEAGTLVTAVLLPLVGNPNILQTDFHYYYDAALRFRADPARLYQLTDDPITGFAYPPPAILPFVALSHLPLGWALLLLTVASYLAVIVSMVWWLQYLRRRGLSIDARTAAIASLVAVALGPTYSNAVFGQVNALVLLCAVGFVAIGPLRPAIGGTLLAIGIWLKIYPVVMVAIGLWNRSAWRRIGYAVIASIALFVLSLAILPWSTFVTFLTDVLPQRFDKTAVHILNQSLVAFLERFTAPTDLYLKWTGEQAIAVNGAVRLLNWAFGIAVIALLWRRATRGPRVESIDSAAAVIALAAVIAPLGWGHTFVLVLPLVALHVVTLRDARAWHAAIVLASVLALMVPAARRFAVIEQLSPWMQNLFYSRYLLATLVLIALPPAIAPDTEARS